MERKSNSTADSRDSEQCPLVLGPGSADLALGPVVECCEHDRTTEQNKTIKAGRPQHSSLRFLFLSLNGLAGAELGDLLLGVTLRYQTVCSPSPE